MKSTIFTLLVSVMLISCSENDSNINSGNVESDACLKIKEAVKTAQTNYVTSSQSSNEATCKTYLNALKDQQIVCGDPNGEIQKIIESLKDCTNND